MNTKQIFFGVILIILASCTNRVPMPKKPNESKRIPINKTIPLEIEKQLNNDQVKTS
jgi:hypothetical protein